MFRNPSPTTNEIDCAFGSLELVASLSGNDVAQKSYGLSHVVTQARDPLACSQGKKLEASRLTTHGAYKRDEPLPWVKDPRPVTIP